MNLTLLGFCINWLNDIKSGQIYETDGAYSLNELELSVFFPNITDKEVNQLCAFMNKEVISGRSYIWSYDQTINIVR